MNTQRWITGAVLLAAAGSAYGQAHPARYRVEDLGHLGSWQAYAMRIAPGGAVVGMATSPPTQDFRAVLWDAQGPLAIPPLPGKTQGVAFDISDAGVVVGTSFTLAALDERAFAYEQGAVRDLGEFQAHAIGAGGAVVGSMAREIPGAGRVDRACVLEHGGSLPRDLGTLGGSSSRALDIADAGDPLIVGVSQLPGDVASHATLWLGGVARDLGTLGGSFSCANAVSSNRQIAGVSTLVSGMPRAFLASVDAGGAVTSRIDLGAFPAGPSGANGLNDAGDVVGTSDSRACIWWGGRIRDLNAMIPSGSGWRLEAAASVNADGVIVGRGYHEGIPAAFRLVPATLCAADFNTDGVVNSQDYFDYVVEFFVGSSAADFNADTLWNSQDFFDFLSAFFAGC